MSELDHCFAIGKGRRGEEEELVARPRSAIHCFIPLSLSNYPKMFH